MVLELSTFEKKLKNLEPTKISQKTLKVYGSIICGYFFIEFIDFLLKDKSLLDYANLFCSNKNEKNNKMILRYFQ